MRTIAERPARPVGDGFDNAPLLRVQEVAAVLNVRVKRVYELPIRQVRLGRRSIRWRPSDLRDFIERRLEVI